VAFAGDAGGIGDDVDWTVDPAVDAELFRCVTDPRPTEHVVEFAERRCAIRFVRPAWPEPVDHPYGWHWFDWCQLVGVDPRAVTTTFHAWRVSADGAPDGVAPPDSLLLEAWAAGYLLGASAAGTGAVVDPEASTVTLAARSWAQSGLGRHASPTAVTWAAEACLEGLRHGAPVTRERVWCHA
jgi:hypothetical protein